MTGHAKKAFFALAALGVGVGLWFAHAAAPPAATEKQARLRDRDFRAALMKRVDFPGIDDPKATLPEALEQLGKRHGVVFSINEHAFKFEQLNDVPTAPIAEKYELPAMKGVPLVAVLRKILTRVPVPSGATFLIRRDAIEITTDNAVRRELKWPVPAPDVANFDEPRTELFVNLLWEEIEDEPLAAALGRLAEVMETTILLDPRAKEKAATKLTATLRNVPLDEALELLTDMAGLAVVRRSNAYYITTAENAARMKQPAPSKKKAEKE